MKFLYALLLIISINCTAQVSSSCIADSVMVSRYSDDARNLALKRLYQLKSPDTQSIEIPQIHVDSILEGMAAINNTLSAIEADSVFHIYCIHIYQMLYTYNFYVSTPENLNPGTPANDILLRHGCSFVTPTYANVGIHANHYINFKALADSISIYTPIILAGPQFITGDGNSIDYFLESNRIYHFHLGWGDCPSGCTAHKTWSYSVDWSCNVTLDSVRSLGYDWEGPYKPMCDTYVGLNPEPTGTQPGIFPNPATTLLHIDAGNTNSSYTIYSLLGKEVTAGLIHTGKAVDISALLPGIYIIKIGGSYTRFMKL